jgi:hypothetical protein
VVLVVDIEAPVTADLPAPATALAQQVHHVLYREGEGSEKKKKKGE